MHLILQEIPGCWIFSSYEGHKGGKKWMETLNLNLKFKKLERCTVVVAKRSGCEIFNFVFNWADAKFLTSFRTVVC